MEHSFLKREDYEESCCPFAKPDQPVTVPVDRVVRRLDEYLSRNDYDAAQRHLDYWLAEAELVGDRRGRLTVLNERIGLFRKLNRKSEGLEAVREALALARELDLTHTVSMGTTLVNAATALCAFGRSREALPLYEEAQRLYEGILPEADSRLGGLYNTSSAMSFKDADKRLLDWYKREIAKYEIKINFNTEINDLGTLRGYDEIIVATGSVPRIMPTIPGFDKTVTLTQLLREKKEVGDKVMFFGGGQSACEAAYEMILQGKHPMIVEYAKDLVPAQNVCLANASFLRDMMDYKQVPVYLESTITEIGDGYVIVRHKDGTTEKVECDDVVNGIGFVPTPIGEKARNVHRVGDCVAIGNLRTAIWRAWDVCMKI